MFFTNNKKVQSLEARVRELEATLDQYRQALEFYADPDAWEPGMKYRDAENRTVFNDRETIAIALDRGRRARAALEASAPDAGPAESTAFPDKTEFRG